MKQPWQRFPIEFREEQTSYELSLEAERHLRCGFENISTFFARAIPPRLLDFLRIAAAVHFVDRIVPRQRRGAATRRISFSVGVCDPDFWTASGRKDAIEEIVEFLSGDCWTFKPTRHGFANRPRLMDARPDKLRGARVCLYSGGLDSAAGLGIHLASAPGEPLVAVTIRHQRGQRKLTSLQFEGLRHSARKQVMPLVLPVTMFGASQLDTQRDESTQRCRSFLFTAVGSVAAVLTGVDRVDVLESGVGALNVPPMSGMTGWMTTKGCHPKFLRLMSALVSAVAGRDITVGLPYAKFTKAEMVRCLADLGDGHLVKQTVSCVHYPLRSKEFKQCGVCPACLLRRQAVLCSKDGIADCPYQYDLFAGSEVANAVPEEQLTYLKAYLMQVADIELAANRGTLPESAVRYLQATGAVEAPEDLKNATSLLQRYSAEWLQLADKYRRQGCRWGEMLSPNSPNCTENHEHASA